MIRRCGEIGRHEGLKIPSQKCGTGSSPVSGTNTVNVLFWDVYGTFFAFDFCNVSDIKEDIYVNFARVLKKF